MSKQSRSRKSRSLLRRAPKRASAGRNTIRGLVVVVLAGFMIAQPTISMGRPGNILNSIEAPGVGGPTVEKRGIGAGDMSYASKTGAFQYSYGFTVPPGRNGMQPSLALAYSSQGSIRGSTMGANWSMGIPMIERDTSEGTLGLAPGMAAHDDLPFVSSMAGGHRLVPVTEGEIAGWSTYRAEYDDSYTRYERNDSGGQWRARTLDGKTWYFGIGHDDEEDSVDDPPKLIVESRSAPFNTSLDHQPLTRVVDRFGNTVRYQWLAISNAAGNVEEFRLEEIRYTENYDAGLGAHARVEFDYIVGPRCDASAKPTVLQAGASVSYRGGEAFFRGRSQLERVVTHVRDAPGSAERVVRQIELDINTVCPDAGSASRQLAAIRTVYPGSPAVDLLRPITFEYGPVERSFDGPIKSVNIPPYQGSVSPATGALFPLSWGYLHAHGSGSTQAQTDFAAESSLEQTFIDMNGDGLLDLVRSGGAGTCEFNVHFASELDGDITFASPSETMAFPDEGMAWANGDATTLGTAGVGEGCSLSARRTLWMSGTPSPLIKPVGNYLTHRFIDMNRDGLPDLVTAIRMDGCVNASLQHPTEPVGTNVDIPGISSVLGTHSDSLEREVYPPNQVTEEQCMPLVAADLEAARTPACPGGNCDLCTSVDMAALQGPLSTASGGDCGQYNLFTDDDDKFGGAGYTGTTYCGGTLNISKKGHYPWMVYYNQGPGTWIDVSSAANTERFWSPVPLSPENGEGSLGSGNGLRVASDKHAVMDMTGDGIIDVVARGNVLTAFPVWYVFPGKLDPNDGTFDGFAEQPQWWTVPGGSAFSESSSATDPNSPGGGPYLTQTSTHSQIVDLNGDGLPDLLALDGSSLRVAMNMGSGFCSRDGDLTLSDDSIDVNAMARTGFFDVLRQPIGPAEWNNISGTGDSLTRLIDVDEDGLPEYVDGWDSSVSYAAQKSTAEVRGNGGNGGFESGSSADQDMSQRLPRAITVNGSNHWFVFSESMDINGDGYLDIINESQTSTYTIASEDIAAGAPLRLLNKIDNGQGLTTEIEYLPYSDSAAQAGVGQSRMKTTIFVTTKVTSSSAQIGSAFTAAPDSEVNIRYGDPMYNEDHRGRWGFRGFESIESSAPHDVGATTGFSVTEQTYNYDVDWSGRLSETIVYADGFAKQAVASITAQTWGEFTLFASATTSYQLDETENRNCTSEVVGSQSFVGYAACIAGAVDRWDSRSYQTYKAYVGGTIDLAYVRSDLTQFNSPGLSDGARLETYAYKLFSDQYSYWLSSNIVSRSERQSGAWVATSTVTNFADSTSKYIEEVGRADGSGGSVFTRESRDASTGSLFATTVPNQFWGHGQTGGGLKTTLTYTGFGINAASVTNDLGHQSKSTIDLGTGLPLETRGPTPLACDPGQNAGSRTEYDKLGRPIDVYEIGCFDGVVGEEPIANFRYANFSPSTGRPAFVQTTTYQEGGSGTGVVSHLFVDGAGRTLLSVAGVGVNQTQSEFVYDARGNVVETLTPNPASSGPTSPVSTRYVYDSLGRVIEVTEDADLLSPAIRSLKIEYGFDGTNTLRTVREETIDGGPEGETVTYTDFFGRLVQVDELGGGSTYATTFYEHDGNDNVSRITDADGIVTEMEHDWLSRRTKVIRGEREWTYAYDRNGNMIAETSSNDIGEEASSPGILYTTTTIYDALDRPDSRMLATRGLSAATLSVYDANAIDFTYDYCDNGLGRLCSVDVGNNLHTEYSYDHAGRITQETKDFSLPESVVDLGDADTDPDFVDTRTSYFEYNLAGAITGVYLADGTTLSDATQLSYNYNNRGEPTDMTWLRPSGDVVTTVTRNAGRRITQQHTGCLTRNWEYDHLGQVLSTEVMGGTGAGSAPGAVACTTANGVLLSEAMTYFHSSEVETHDVYRAGLMAEIFTYQYDSQHQLTRAFTAGTTPLYDVDFAFTGAGRIEEVGGTSAVGRPNLDYAPTAGGYGDGTLTGGDSHAPVSLWGPDANLAYDYDYAGNVTQREEVGYTTNLDPALADIGLLDFLNQTSFAELDDDVPLNSIAATNLMAFRAGSDGINGTADDVDFQTVAEVDAVSWVGPAALADLYAYSALQGWVPGAGDSMGTFDGVPFTYSEAIVSLDWVNTATSAQLDGAPTNLNSIAVTSITNARPIANMETLAGLYYVGGSALGDIKSTASAQSTSSEAWTFAYDGTDQQREVLTPGGGRELYYYDSGGARYMTVSFDDAADIQPSRIRVWIGGAEIWYEPNGSNTAMDVATEYGHLSLGALNIGRVKKEGSVTTAEGSFHNGLSHLMGAVDWDSGVVSAAFVYGPFGEVVASVGAEEDDHLRRFNGKESDLESGLNYYGYRYYDSKSLSWTQADPLYLFVPDLGMGDPRRMNLYSFSLNNPVRYLDPDGRDSDSKIKKTGDAKPGDKGDLDTAACDGMEAPSGQACLGLITSGDHKGKFLLGPSGTSGDGKSEFEMGIDEETKEVALLDGAGGPIPAVSVRMTADQAKAFDGAKILSLLVTGVAGLTRRFAKKGTRKAAKGGVCFAAGTPLTTEDGFKAIDELEVGDEVWSRDEVTGEVRLQPVVRTFERHADDVLDIEFVTEDGDEFELIVTPEHPLWTEAGFAKAGSLDSGDEVWGQNGWAEVFSISSAPPQTVYNVEVAEFHTYFVGKEGVWAHNACGKPSLSAHKDALRQTHQKVGGPLPRGQPGKFGSPQAGTPKKGYRLDPAHPGAKAGTPEAGSHFNWWDYTGGKRGRGGQSGAIPIGD